MKMCPCKDCTNRTESCHSDCTEYVSWKKELNEMRKQEYSEKLVYCAILDHKMKVKQSLRRRYNK